MLLLEVPLKFEQVVCGEQPCMIFRVLGGQDGSQSEALTGMSIVCDGDDISRRVVADAVDSRNLTTANVVYTENVR